LPKEEFFNGILIVYSLLIASHSVEISYPIIIYSMCCLRSANRSYW